MNTTNAFLFFSRELCFLVFMSCSFSVSLKIDNNECSIPAWIAVKRCQICVNHMKIPTRRHMKVAHGAVPKMQIWMLNGMARSRIHHVSKRTPNTTDMFSSQTRPYKMVLMSLVSQCDSLGQTLIKIVRMVRMYHDTMITLTLTPTIITRPAQEDHTRVDRHTRVASIQIQTDTKEIEANRRQVFNWFSSFPMAIVGAAFDLCVFFCHCGSRVSIKIAIQTIAIRADRVAKVTCKTAIIITAIHTRSNQMQPAWIRPMVSSSMVPHHMSTAMVHHQIQSTLIHTMAPLTICNRNSSRYVWYLRFGCFFSAHFQMKLFTILFLLLRFSFLLSLMCDDSSKLLHSNQLRHRHTIQPHIQLHHHQTLFILANTWSMLAFKISSVRTTNVLTKTIDNNNKNANQKDWNAQGRATAESKCLF